MSEEINYKGLLQQYCLGRYPSPPVYETSQVEVATVEGKAQWIVQIKYAKQTFETPCAIAGTKKQAEQEAAKLLMAEIESRQNAFLSGEDFPSDTDLSFPVAEIGDGAQETATPISVPSELVTTALQVASRQLSATSQPSRKGPYRQLPPANNAHQDFVRDVGRLTIQIVRSVVEASYESGKVDFGQSNLDEDSDSGMPSQVRSEQIG